MSESTKKETPKTRISTRVQSKKEKEDDDKIKKRVLKQPTESKRVSKPTPMKKIVSSTKAPSNRPVTPPSSRVTKTQFFPSKKMYSNALKSDDNKKVTLKKKIPERKINDVSPDTSSMSERPRTATLRKGSIVNNNIVGPDVPKIKPSVPPPVEEPPVEYEDDFDSYESDFEEYDSTDSTTNLSTGTTSSSTESIEPKSVTKRVSSAGTDDEKKLDSGNYELPESRHKQILDKIKEAIEKENANLGSNLASNLGSNLGSLSDEGFEDGKSLQFINFLGAQKKYQHRKSVELRRKRGEEILSMIKLDSYSFTLFELAPVPYDIFIKHYGKSNSVQASVQTGEDHVDEEIQTEEICSKNKWTQFPPSFTQIEDNEHFWEIYKCNYLGVGGDIFEKEKTNKTLNESDLEEFLLKAGNLIHNIQVEANMKTNVEINKNNLPFSKGQITYNTQGNDILKNLPINDVGFYANNHNKILTVHGKLKDGNSFVCIWNIFDVNTPETIFIAFGQVLCCTTCFDTPDVILGGLYDGYDGLLCCRFYVYFCLKDYCCMGHKRKSGKSQMYFQ